MSADSLFFILPIVIILIFLAISKTREVIINNWPEIFGLLSAYIFVLGDIHSDNTKLLAFNKTWKELNTIIVLLGATTGLLGIIISGVRERKRNKLSLKLAQIEKMQFVIGKLKKEFYKYCSDRIKFLFSGFFNDAKGQGRVSLYKHVGDTFFLLGRYSPNPELCRHSIDKYPDNEGFIARAWEDGDFSIHNIPKWEGKLGTDYRRFTQSFCNISDARLKILRMHSRSFFIIRLDNEDSEKPHGIIVFEKLDPEPIDAEIISRIFRESHHELVSLIKSMNTFFTANE